MKEPTDKRSAIWVLIPLFGTLVFVILYGLATLFYPGGSQVDKNEKGFSWSQNYWCNLLNENAINGQPNAARPIALTAMIVLCVSLSLFWYIFPTLINLPKRTKHVIQISGILSMATSLFLFTAGHDMVINIASVLGLIAITGIFIGLRKMNWTDLFWFGIFNIALVVCNNVLYYGEGLRFYLPVVQKISFLSFLLWLCGINIRLFNHMNVKRRSASVNQVHPDTSL